MKQLRAYRHKIISMLSRVQQLELSRAAKLRLQWFLFAVEHDCNVSLTCRHFGIARTTFLRWANRFDPADPTSLEEYSRKPHTVRKPETDNYAVELIRKYRERFPLMSKFEIAQKLQDEHSITLSASSVGRTIARNGFFFADTDAHRRKRQAAEPMEFIGSEQNRTQEQSTEETSGSSAWEVLGDLPLGT